MRNASATRPWQPSPTPGSTACRSWATCNTCSAQSQEYVDAGVDTPLVFPLPWGEDRTAVVEQTLAAALPSKPA